MDDRCKRLTHLDQNGMLEGVWFPNARRVVTNPAGVEQAANGSIVCTCGTWEILHRFLPEGMSVPGARECQRAGRMAEAA